MFLAVSNGIRCREKSVKRCWCHLIWLEKGEAERDNTDKSFENELGAVLLLVLSELRSCFFFDLWLLLRSSWCRPSW